MSDIRKRFEEETMRFLFICPADDVKLLVDRYKKLIMPEYVRLACLALAFGFKLVFIKIARKVDKDQKEFFAGLDKLDGNFNQLDIWVKNFIDGGRNAAAQALCRETWATRKTELDKPKFSVKCLLNTL